MDTDNSRVLTDQDNEHWGRTDDSVPDLYRLSAPEYAPNALADDPTGAPMVVALVVVTAAISGFFIGVMLGPAAFTMMR